MTTGSRLKLQMYSRMILMCVACAGLVLSFLISNIALLVICVIVSLLAILYFGSTGNYYINESNCHENKIRGITMTNDY